MSEHKLTQCKTCRFLHPGEKHNECRESSPQLTHVLVPVQTMGGQGMAIQTISAWPPVQDDNWCAKYESRIQLSNWN